MVVDYVWIAKGAALGLCDVHRRTGLPRADGGVVDVVRTERSKSRRRLSMAVLRIWTVYRVDTVRRAGGGWSCESTLAAERERDDERAVSGLASSNVRRRGRHCCTQLWHESNSGGHGSLDKHGWGSVCWTLMAGVGLGQST